MEQRAEPSAGIVAVIGGPSAQAAARDRQGFARPRDARGIAGGRSSIRPVRSGRHTSHVFAGDGRDSPSIAWKTVVVLETVHEAWLPRHRRQPVSARHQPTSAKATAGKQEVRDAGRSLTQSPGGPPTRAVFSGRQPFGAGCEHDEALRICRLLWEIGGI